MPSFHFIDVAVIFVVPSSRKVNVFVSFVSSKYGLALKFYNRQRRTLGTYMLTLYHKTSKWTALLHV